MSDYGAIGRQRGSEADRRSVRGGGSSTTRNLKGFCGRRSCISGASKIRGAMRTVYSWTSSRSAAVVGVKWSVFSRCSNIWSRPSRRSHSAQAAFSLNRSYQPLGCFVPHSNNVPCEALHQSVQHRTQVENSRSLFSINSFEVSNQPTPLACSTQWKSRTSTKPICFTDLARSRKTAASFWVPKVSPMRSAMEWQSES